MTYLVEINPDAQGEAAVTDHPTPEAGPDPRTAPVLNLDVPHATPDRPLSAPARRALLEAAARRSKAAETVSPTEHGGPRGPEPTRYGDWEKKGLAIDF